MFVGLRSVSDTAMRQKFLTHLLGADAAIDRQGDTGDRPRVFTA